MASSAASYDNFEKRVHSLRRSTYAEDRDRERERERERERDYIRRDALVTNNPYHRYDEPLSSLGATYRPSNYTGYDDSHRYSQYSHYYNQSSSASLYTPSSLYPGNHRDPYQ